MTGKSKDMAHPQNESLRQKIDRVVFPKGSRRRTFAQAAGATIAGAAIIGGLAVGADAAVNTLAPAPKVEDLRPDQINQIQRGADLKLYLKPDRRYDVTVITFTNPDTKQQTVDLERVPGDKIDSVEGKPVPDGATVADVTDLGVNEKSQVPVDITFTDAQGQVEEGVLTVEFFRNPDINLGNQPLVDVQGNIQRSDQRQRIETGTGLPVNNVTFETPTSTSSTSSQ
jgi:hypothetical protein